MPKFAPTGESVESVILKLKSKNKQADAWKLLDLFKSVAKLEPVVWHPGIIGFGTFHYKYETGVEGDSPLLAFAPRQTKISLYIDQDLPSRDDYLNRLGKVSKAVGCVYVNKLSDIDLSVLEELLEALLSHTKSKIKSN
ncbi:DUF1801 domain-containing protein [Guggenheimella bovis]